MASSRAFHLTSRVNDTHGSPTCFHLPSGKCGLIVPICLIRELRVLRKWLHGRLTVVQVWGQIVFLGVGKSNNVIILKDYIQICGKYAH